MHNVWEANGVDHETPELAIAAVEERGNGSVVKFHGTQNNPGCKPDIVYRSSAMWSFIDGKWSAMSIHGGTCEAIFEQKPY